MNPLAALGIVLAISLGGNAYLLHALQGKAQEVGELSQAKDIAVESAKTCSASIDKIAKDAQEQAEKAKTAIDEAQARAKDSERRARAELLRKQAVPGDACASAQVENKAWLENRKKRQ